MSSRVDGESVREPPDVSVDRGDLDDPLTAEQRWPRDPVVWALALLGLVALGSLLARAARLADEAGADLLAAIGAATYPVFDLAFLFAVVSVILRGVRPSSQAALTFIA